MGRASTVLLWLVFTVQCVAIGGARITLPSQRWSSSSASGGEAAVVNSRPLVGILSQPGDGMEYSLTSDWNAMGEKPLPPNYTTSYIAASYVKFVEAGGGRVVPLIYNEPEEVLREVGLIFRVLIFFPEVFCGSRATGDKNLLLLSVRNGEIIARRQ